MAAVATVSALPPRRHNRLVPIAATPIPEPTQLYCLVALAFFTHVPDTHTVSARCVQCPTARPCEQVGLAYRLREGF